MKASLKTALSIFFLLLVISASDLQAQMVRVGTPVIRMNDSFFERFGVGWFANNMRPDGSGWFFNFPGLNAAPPPFGNRVPADDATFGFGGRNGNLNYGFNFAASQGSNRSVIAEEPFVVVPNGFGGAISDTRIRPFVTGFVPVVGEHIVGPQVGPRIPRQLPVKQEAQEPKEEPSLAKKKAAAPIRSSSSVRSTATHGDLSVEEIKRQQKRKQAKADAEIDALIERGKGAEQLGRLGAAKIYYRQAARRAAPELKAKILEHVKSLK